MSSAIINTKPTINRKRKAEATIVFVKEAPILPLSKEAFILVASCLFYDVFTGLPHGCNLNIFFENHQSAMDTIKNTAEINGDLQDIIQAFSSSYKLYSPCKLIPVDSLKLESSSRLHLIVDSHGESVMKLGTLSTVKYSEDLDGLIL